MSFRATWEQDAANALKKLDATIVRRIITRVNWLAKNLESIKPQAFSGTLKDYFKLRVGSYRVIYSINREQKEIIINFLGHRRDIYKSK